MSAIDITLKKITYSESWDYVEDVDMCQYDIHISILYILAFKYSYIL